MPLVALTIAALAIACEQLLQLKFGVMGLVAFITLAVGIKAKNSTIGGIGAVILVVLLAQNG